MLISVLPAKNMSSNAKQCVSNVHIYMRSLWNKYLKQNSILLVLFESLVPNVGDGDDSYIKGNWGHLDMIGWNLIIDTNRLQAWRSSFK